jgi:hypothetical protein
MYHERTPAAPPRSRSHFSRSTQRPGAIKIEITDPHCSKLTPELSPQWPRPTLRASSTAEHPLPPTLVLLVAPGAYAGLFPPGVLVLGPLDRRVRVLHNDLSFAFGPAYSFDGDPYGAAAEVSGLDVGLLQVA